MWSQLVVVLTPRLDDRPRFRRWETARLDDLLGGMNRMEFMLRFTLTNPDLDTTIVGTRDPAHLQQNIEAAFRGPLPEDVMREAMQRLDLVGSRPRQ